MREIIDKIKEKVDIVQLISQYVSLQKVGSNYRGLCPFHSERTPSFFVNPNLKLYHCFGCGASGDAIKFIQEIEHISFADALKKLAAMVNVELPAVQEDKDKQLYLEYCRNLHEFYKMQLEKSKEAQEHLLKRGLTPSEIGEYEFGYCPPGSKAAVQIGSKLGLSISKILQLGFVKQMSSDYVDVFENRIIIPIKDATGRTIAFGGRALSGEPKYLNLRDTLYFSKRRTLFLMDRAQKAIKAADFVVITEGYFDAIAMHRAGIKTAVAVLGTVLSKDHIIKLSPLTKNVILCFDNDEAGRRATLKSLLLLTEAGFDATIAAVSEKDPDELLRSSGPEALHQMLKTSTPFEEYITAFYLQAFDISTASGLEKYLYKIKAWKDFLEKNKRLEKVDGLLKAVSEKTGLPVHRISQKLSLSATTMSGVSKQSNLPSDEDYLVYLYLTNEDLRKEILKIDQTVLSEKTVAVILELQHQSDIAQVKPEVRDYLFDLLSRIPPPSNPLKAFEDIKRRFARKVVEKLLSQIDAKLANCDDEMQRAMLLRQRVELLKSLGKLGGG